MGRLGCVFIHLHNVRISIIYPTLIIPHCHGIVWQLHLMLTTVYVWVACTYLYTRVPDSSNTRNDAMPSPASLYAQSQQYLTPPVITAAAPYKRLSNPFELFYDTNVESSVLDVYIVQKSVEECIHQKLQLPTHWDLKFWCCSNVLYLHFIVLHCVLLCFTGIVLHTSSIKVRVYLSIRLSTVECAAFMGGRSGNSSVGFSAIWCWNAVLTAIQCCNSIQRVFSAYWSTRPGWSSAFQCPSSSRFIRKDWRSVSLCCSNLLYQAKCKRH